MDDSRRHELARGERLIAGTRLVLAAFALIVLLIDPDLTRESSVRLSVIGVLFGVYAAVLAIVSRRPAIARLEARLALQASDFLFFSVLIFQTHASVSPFFIFFLFSLITALLRFGVRGMVATSAAAIGVYVLMALADDRIRADPGYLVMRSTSLAVATLLLARVGAHYARIRSELTKLAAWPRVVAGEREGVVREVLTTSRDLLGVGRVLLIWDEEEEPWVNAALLSGENLTLTREPPDLAEWMVEDALRDATFLQHHAQGRVEAIRASSGSPPVSELAAAVTDEARRRFGMTNVISAPVRGQSLNGRIFFLDGEPMEVGDLAVADLAARLVAATIDQMNATQRSRNAAVAEERLRVGRDLHDGVLQSLTGVALQLEMLRHTVERDPGAARERLRNLQELIETDQRELRAMISHLRPHTEAAPPSLDGRLAELARRFERQWDVKVSVSVAPPAAVIPEPLAAELYSTINEAVANAAKHSRGANIGVMVDIEPSDVVISVADDGVGFPFQGTFTLEQLNSERRGPVTLKERVASLGGDLVLSSAGDGSRIRIRLPRHAAPERERRLV